MWTARRQVRRSTGSWDYDSSPAGALSAFRGLRSLADDTSPVRVEVPLAVPCRVPDVRPPSWAGATLKAGDSLQAKVRALLAERRQRQGYELELQAALRACR